MKKLTFIFIFSFIIFLSNCKNETSSSGTDNSSDCVDFSGRKYKTIKIGNQIWMAENLNVGQYINASKDQTLNGIVEKYCYNNDSLISITEGGLYQWSELFEPNFCPKGWRIPNEKDFSDLIKFIGGSSKGDRLMGNGDLGFNCNFSGNCWHGKFSDSGTKGYYWTKSEKDSKNAVFVLVSTLCPDILFYDDTKISGLSVRCIKE